jgi:hypothetical protein
MTDILQGPDLEQVLADVAAKTGVSLNSERLLPTLVNVQAPFEARKVITVGVEIRIDASSAESLELAASQLHEIADRVKAAAATRRASMPAPGRYAP